MAESRVQLTSVTQGNPKGKGQGDLAKLLRTFADTVDEIGAFDFEDMVVHEDITEDGSWLSFTLYYSKPLLTAVPNE